MCRACRVFTGGNGWGGQSDTHTHSSVLPFKCDEAQISTSDHYAEVRVKGYGECDMGLLVSLSVCQSAN